MNGFTRREALRLGLFAALALPFAGLFAKAAAKCGAMPRKRKIVIDRIWMNDRVVFASVRPRGAEGVAMSKGTPRCDFAYCYAELGDLFRPGPTWGIISDYHAQS